MIIQLTNGRARIWTEACHLPGLASTLPLLWQWRKSNSTEEMRFKILLFQRKKNQDVSTPARVGHFILRWFFFFFNYQAKHSWFCVRGKERGVRVRMGRRKWVAEKERSHINICIVLRKQENPNHSTAQIPNKRRGEAVFPEKIFFLL